MAQSALGMIDGAETYCLDIHGPAGLRAEILTWGARLAALWVPDPSGRLADIALGHDTAADWQASECYFGATCGRYANRIAGSRYMLDGKLHLLTPNEGETQLHGGPRGFDRRHWTVVSATDAHVCLQLVSEDGDMGHPGRLRAEVDYRFDARGRLQVTMAAECDAACMVNLVNHTYFNMAGQGSGPVLDQQLQIEAGHYTPVDAALIPDGRVLAVAGTPLDFRNLRRIGASLPAAQGFDHNFCLSAPLDGEGLRPCALACDPVSGRRMAVLTDQPGVQLYTGGFIPEGLPGKAGAALGPFSGFCLETQRFPDAPNQPHFPSARLDPGQRYRHRMVFDFSPVPG